jgi:hypothetical protein
VWKNWRRQIDEPDMNRRSFILLTGSGLSALCIPFVDCSNRNFANHAKPELLSQLCDDGTIQLLGREYLQSRPDERNIDRLTKELYGDSLNIATLDHRDMLVFQGQLQDSIRNDFAGGQITVLKGWILSLTEARQCALYFILNA